MRALALALALVALPAAAQGLGGPGLASGSFSASILGPGSTGTDLTLSGTMTAAKFVATGSSVTSYDASSCSTGQYCYKMPNNSGLFMSSSDSIFNINVGGANSGQFSSTTATLPGTLTVTGSLSTTREFPLDKVSSGIGAGSLLATGTNYSGFKLPGAWTLTHVSMNVTTASTATVANTVITYTDGTNTCTATFACNTVTNTTGVKDVAVANGAGTGCVYAASALVTVSVTTQGCATAVTTNSITTWGKPQ